MNKTIQYHPRAKYIDCALSNRDYCDKCGWVRGKPIKWQSEFQKQYLLQQNEKPTKQNIKEYGLDLEYSELLKETDTAFIVYHNEGNPTINIIYKNGRFMESLEIA